MNNKSNTRYIWDTMDQIFIKWRNTSRQNEEQIPAHSTIQNGVTTYALR